MKKNTRRILFILLLMSLLAGLVVWRASRPRHLSRYETAWETIWPGMNVAEVTAILGEPTDSFSNGGLASFSGNPHLEGDGIAWITPSDEEYFGVTVENDVVKETVYGRKRVGFLRVIATFLGVGPEWEITWF